MKRILLIDGDIVAFAAASAVETAIEWEPGEFSSYASLEDAQAAVETTLAKYVDDLKADEIKIALTDSPGNFRKKVLPTYKANRAGQRKPLILSQVRKWMIDTLQATLIPTLEGDDVLGVWSTHPGLKGEKIVVSIDKDMQSIPGLIYCPGKDTEPREITEAQADRFHFIQTLSGDAVDGYAGCPGTGAVKAARLVDDPELARDPVKTWEAILACYKKAGLGPEEALRQAQVARICRASDYNSKQKKVILWKPTLSKPKAQ